MPNLRDKRLSVFGSVLHGDETPSSDLDLLVEFHPGQRLGLSFFRLEYELSDLLNRTVDLNTPNFLSRHFREQILREAYPVYVAE